MVLQGQLIKTTHVMIKNSGEIDAKLTKAPIKRLVKFNIYFFLTFQELSPESHIIMWSRFQN